MILERHRPPQPRGEQFQSRHDIRGLTVTSKNLYIPFNTFELEMSRLYVKQSFTDLVGQLFLFNQELDSWKSQKHQIPNIVLTYHLYENLFSRLKYISNFAQNEHDAQNAISEATRWFQVEKPKIRCQVKEVKASIKSISLDPKESNLIDSLAQTSALKREMQPYEVRSRTVHSGLFPPKEELKKYKRKEFFPFSEPTDGPTRSCSSIVKQSKLSMYRASLTTMMASTSNSYYPRKQTSAPNVREFQLVQVEEGKLQDNIDISPNQDTPQQIEQEALQSLERQKKVQQGEFLKENLVDQKHEQDEDDDQVLSTGEEKQGNKIYTKDYEPLEVMAAEEESKEASQSTLRRVMRINELKVQSKLEQLDIKRNMVNWGKVKGKYAREESRKLQSLLHLNKYKDLAFQKVPSTGAVKGKALFNATQGFRDYKTAQQHTPIPMLFRNKSSHPTSMEKDIEALRIGAALRRYGKYIDHLQAPAVSSEEAIQKQAEKGKDSDFRSMSLTSFACRGKKEDFSGVIGRHNTGVYNENVECEVLSVKSKLAGKQVSVENRSLYRALSVGEGEKVEAGFSCGRGLLSNPFFPKSTGGKKKKKAKK